MLEAEIDQIRLALAKPPQSRSYDDLLLLRSILKKTELIPNRLANCINLKDMNDFCRNLGIEFYSNDGIVFNQGDVSDKVYVILRGSCEAHVKFNFDLLNGEFETREKIIEKYSERQAFGERGLQFNEPRWATIRCLSPTTLITVTKTNYLNLLNAAGQYVATKKHEEVQVGTKENVITVLSKARQARQREELDGVAKYLHSRIPFFQKFSHQQMIELCRVAESETIHGRSILFKQGQIGQAFYVILTGTVEIWVHEKEDEMKSDYAAAAEPLHYSVTAPTPSHRSHHFTPSTHHKGDLTDGLGLKVNQLVTGDVFGERALENDSSQRMASVLSCEEVTELIVISRQDYHNLVSMMMQTENMQRLTLLRRTILFGTVDVVHLKVLAMFMKQKIYRRDKYLAEAGKRATEMLFIEKGECRVETKVLEGFEKLTEQEKFEVKHKHYYEGTAHIRGADGHNSSSLAGSDTEGDEKHHHHHHGSSGHGSGHGSHAHPSDDEEAKRHTPIPHHEKPRYFKMPHHDASDSEDEHSIHHHHTSHHNHTPAHDNHSHNQSSPHTVLPKHEETREEHEHHHETTKTDGSTQQRRSSHGGGGERRASLSRRPSNPHPKPHQLDFRQYSAHTHNSKKDDNIRGNAERSAEQRHRDSVRIEEMARHVEELRMMAEAPAIVQKIEQRKERSGGKVRRFDSMDLTAADGGDTQAHYHTVKIGRLGPGSVIAPYVTQCEWIHNEVFHPETIVTDSVVYAFSISKHDFFQNMPRDTRDAIVRVVEEFQTPALNLWENVPRVLDEDSWKREKTWELFKNRVANEHGVGARNFVEQQNILDTLHSLSRMHITAGSGNDQARIMNRNQLLQEAAEHVTGTHRSRVEVTMDWGLPKDATVAAAAAALVEQQTAHGLATTTTTTSTLAPLDVSILEEGIAHMQYKKHFPKTHLETKKSGEYRPFTVHGVGSPHRRAITAVVSDVVHRRTIRTAGGGPPPPAAGIAHQHPMLSSSFLISQRAEENKHNWHRNSSAGAFEPIAEQASENSSLQGAINKAVAQAMASEDEEASCGSRSAAGGNDDAPPAYVLVQFHRDESKAKNLPPGVQKRAPRCYLRLCGAAASVKEVKEIADVQMETAFLSLFKEDPSKEKELILKWKYIESVQHMSAQDTDHFMIFSGATLVEYASIHPSMNLFNVQFTPMRKLKRQRYAVIAANALIPSEPAPAEDDSHVRRKRRHRHHRHHHHRHHHSSSNGQKEEGKEVPSMTLTELSLASSEDECDASSLVSGSISLHRPINRRKSMEGSIRRSMEYSAEAAKAVAAVSEAAVNPVTAVEPQQQVAPNPAEDVPQTLPPPEVSEGTRILNAFSVVSEVLGTRTTRLDCLRYAIHRFGKFVTISDDNTAAEGANKAAATPAANSKVPATPAAATLKKHKKVVLKEISDAATVDPLLRSIRKENKRVCVLPMFSWLLVTEESFLGMDFLHACDETAGHVLEIEEKLGLTHMKSLETAKAVKERGMRRSNSNERPGTQQQQPVRRNSVFSSNVTTMRKSASEASTAMPPVLAAGDDISYALTDSGDEHDEASPKKKRSSNKGKMTRASMELKPLTEAPPGTLTLLQPQAIRPSSRGAAAIIKALPPIQIAAQQQVPFASVASLTATDQRPFTAELGKTNRAQLGSRDGPSSVSKPSRDSPSLLKKSFNRAVSGGDSTPPPSQISSALTRSSSNLGGYNGTSSTSTNKHKHQLSPLKTRANLYNAVAEMSINHIGPPGTVGKRIAENLKLLADTLFVENYESEKKKKRQHIHRESRQET